MTGLPHGWSSLRLNSVAEVRGGIQKQAKRRPVNNKYPFLRVANVLRGGLDLHDVHEVELFNGEIDRYRLKSGDLLVVEGNGSPDQIGRAAIWDGSIRDCVHQNHLIRVRPSSQLLPKYLEYAWNSPRTARHLRQVAGSTSGLYTLSTAKVNAVEIPLCSLDEQQQIVDILESHLSRLERGRQELDKVSRRLNTLLKGLLLEAIPDAYSYPPSWRRATVAEAGKVELGRQRHPDWHVGPNMRSYLRVANVFEDRIDLRDVKEMHWPAETFNRFRLRPGDVLLNEGQSPELLGRPALYRGDPQEVAFTNTLLRFQAHQDVLPEFALMVFRRHMHAGRFAREARITTNIAHLSSARLKPIEFPIPPLEEQHRLVKRVQDQLDSVVRLQGAISAAQTRRSALRQNLLAAAFSGRLTERSSDVGLVKEWAGV